MQEEQNKNILNPYFVTGLVDGEGSFTYWRQCSGQIQPCFSVSLNIHDLELLIKLKKFFGGIGDIYQRPPRPFRGNDNILYIPGAMSMYRVCQIDELLIIRQHFIIYPLEGKKAKAFEIWDEMVVCKRFERPGQNVMLDKLALKLTIANGGKSFKRRHTSKKSVI